ncbi:MAG: TonB family protein [Edaphocola sp.]
MDINKILKADYLDILFEGRNKKYGAYELRKKYSKRAAIAGLISVGVVGGIFAATMIKPKEKIEAVAPVDVKDVQLAEPPPMDPKKPPPPPPVAPPPPVKPTVKFTPPIIKKNEEVHEEEMIKEPPKDEKVVVGPADIKGSGDPDAIDPGLSSQSGTGKGGPVEEAGPPVDKIFTSVEQMPTPPFDVNQYLAKNIRYPAAAREDNIQGRVVLQFVVDKDGSVTDIVIKKDIGGGCGKEAERVVRSMPKWKPGKQNGQPVKVYFTLPVSFKLAE